MKINKYSKYIWEFLSIFFAVIFAFALTNWNDNRKDDLAAEKILEELANGLNKDLEDLAQNKMGHEVGVRACDYWVDYFNGSVPTVSALDTNAVMKLKSMFFNVTRDYISIINDSAYESLKSKGLELIENDSLRLKIINLYEFDYEILTKFEEDYVEAQFQESYFEALSMEIAPFMQFNTEGDLMGIKPNTRIDSEKRNLLLSYLWKIKTNREFIISYYDMVKLNVLELQELINTTLTDNEHK